MPIEIKMPALSPTMEEGTLAKWLVKEGDTVKSGDLMAEIETDKATMEFEAVDEGTIGKIMIAAGTDNVKVGAVIAILLGEGEGATTPEPAARESEPQPDPTDPNKTGDEAAPAPVSGASDHGNPSSALPAGDGQARSAPPPEGEGKAPPSPLPASAVAAPPSSDASGKEERLKVSPLARRIAGEKGVDLAALTGSGPNGRIVKADLAGAKPSATVGTPPAEPVAVAPTPPAATASTAPAPAATAPVAKPAPKPVAIPDIPHTAAKLSNVRKTIARRLTESKQTVPHIYLTVDIRLDALLKLRGDLNASLAPRGVKLSVNDLVIKALAAALVQVPKCNVMFTPDQLISFTRADISVAVSTPSGLITPIIASADTKGVAAISTEMKDLAARARDGKLAPQEYMGGTASLSNMGMYGIKQFEAVINPPQGMILAIGAGEKRPYVIDDALGIATVMSATGSFDHRAIDGADGAELMQAFKALVEAPLGMLA